MQPKLPILSIFVPRPNRNRGVTSPGGRSFTSTSTSCALPEPAAGHNPRLTRGTQRSALDPADIADAGASCWCANPSSSVACFSADGVQSRWAGRPPSRRVPLHSEVHLRRSRLEHLRSEAPRLLCQIGLIAFRLRLPAGPAPHRRWMYRLHSPGHWTPIRDLVITSTIFSLFGSSYTALSLKPSHALPETLTYRTFSAFTLAGYVVLVHDYTITFGDEVQ